MPCRALEAFRHCQLPGCPRTQALRLNALSGIGGVQTEEEREWRPPLQERLNALSGIGGVQTLFMRAMRPPALVGLNALSGIGGVQTGSRRLPSCRRTWVLMPCRALEAFRHRDIVTGTSQGGIWVLMPCRALEAFRLHNWAKTSDPC